MSSMILGTQSTLRSSHYSRREMDAYPFVKSFLLVIFLEHMDMELDYFFRNLSSELHEQRRYLDK